MIAPLYHHFSKWAPHINFSQSREAAAGLKNTTNTEQTTPDRLIGAPSVLINGVENVLRNEEWLERKSLLNIVQ